MNEDAHEAVVTHAEFDAAETVKKSLLRRRDGSIAAQAMLGGLFRCVACGHTLRITGNTDRKTGTRYSVYCTGRCASGICPARAKARASLVDANVKQQELAALRAENELIAQAVVASERVQAAGAVAFVFSADEPSSFECNLDARGFAPCSSPATYHGLGDGAHDFSVRANDVVDNLSAPVGHSWTIDTTPPETTLAAAPTSGTATSATFAFSANERTTFECRLDGAPFTLCGTPKSYAGLGHGDHQFQVRASDVAGNAHPTPSLHGWRVASSLLSPRAGARVNRPPLLVWRRVTGARYYHVQVFRGRRKVFSGWPTRTRIQLKAKWRNSGRIERLLPGRYRWYVWLGYGNPRRYRALLGQSTFFVPRASTRR